MAVGVYKITNTINNKCYIGSTRRLSERRNEHKYKLKKSKGNSIIRSAVIKYGEENFIFEILEEFVFTDFASSDYIDELITSREQYFVNTLQPEYNIKIKDVTSSNGISTHDKNPHKSGLSKREIARRNKGKNDKKVKIDVYKTENLEFIETVVGLRNCNKIYKSNCYNICKHGYTSQYTGEYVFCYHGVDINKAFREHAKFTFKRKDAVPVIQIDRNGNFVREWRTGSDAEKELGLYKGSISRVIRGEYSHTKNYYFKPKNQES